MQKLSYLPPEEIALRGSRYHRHPGPYPVEWRDLAVICPGFREQSVSKDVDERSPYRSGELHPSGRPFLLGLVRWLQPELIVELGTFTGKTTLLLSCEVPSARVITIDCPADKLANGGGHYGTDDAYLQPRDAIGSVYRGTDGASRITQILAKTGSDECALALDAALDGAAIEFAFIDASHSYSSVKCDFEQLILPRLGEHGVVVFDDYGLLMTHSGVTLYLLQKAYEEGFLFYWFAPSPSPTNCVLFSPHLNRIHASLHRS